MKYRKLRIAWSVAWAVVAVLLCVLWVRSYTSGDSIRRAGEENDIALMSVIGTVQLASFHNPLGLRDGSWRISHTELDPTTGPKNVFQWFDWDNDPSYGLRIITPWWIHVAIVATLGFLPWFSVRRFSLRTILIATTLVAVGLGLVVWLAAK